MAVFYIRDDGTAPASSDAGRSVTPRTGAWNASPGDSYGSLEDAVDGAKPNPPTAGDVIGFSSATNYTNTSSTSTIIPSGVTLLVLDDADQDEIVADAPTLVQSAAPNTYAIRPSAGAVEGLNVRGLRIQTGGETTYVGSNEATKICEAAVEFTSAGGDLLLLPRGSQTRFINTDISWTSPTASGAFRASSDRLAYYGGSVTVGSNAPYHLYTRGYGPNGFIVGTDFSQGRPNVPIMSYFASATYNQARTHILGCPLPTGWSIENENATNRLFCVVQKCDSANQYVMETYGGSAEFVTDVYYTAHETLDDGTTKGAYELSSNANASPVSPLYLFDPNHWTIMARENTEAATKTKVRLRIAAASGSTITASDIDVIVFYPNSAVPYHIDVTEYHLSELKTGPALPTETGAWTGPGLGAQYILDVDMGTPGNGMVGVIPGLTKPNTTINISWQLEFVA